MQEDAGGPRSVRVGQIGMVEFLIRFFSLRFLIDFRISKAISRLTTPRSLDPVTMISFASHLCKEVYMCRRLFVLNHLSLYEKFYKFLALIFFI